LEAARQARHDLRNIVGAVCGYAEMVKEDLEDAKNTAYIQELTDILSAAQNVERQINESIHFNRIKRDQTRGAEALNQDDLIAQKFDMEIEFDDFSENSVTLTGRILVVDDEALNRDLLATMLWRDGHVVASAQSGTEALKIMAESSFDVVLLDLMMPELNGFEVMARMRTNAKMRHIRIVVISGMDQDENAIKCIGYGAEDFLTKPVNALLLRARIGACLARQRWQEHERLYRMHLESEKSKSDALLLNTLPAPIVERLSSGEKVIADSFDNVTVLFSDIVNFTSFSNTREPREVVEVLNRIFTEFDELTIDLGIEKIKTIGDGYLVVAGLPVPREDHAEVMAEMALGMLLIVESLNQKYGTDLQIRIGMDTGTVVAGVIGSHKFAYDVWGKTVNSAARYESYSQPGKIHMSSAVAALLSAKFNITGRGSLTLRGLGRVTTYFLDDHKDQKTVLRDGSTGTADIHQIQSVLIVDDDESILDIMKRRFIRLGWRVHVVTDGEQAWDALQSSQFSLLLTDCDMPRLNGLDLTARVREAEIDGETHLPIVAMTGNDSVEYAQQCLDAGVNAFLLKPVMWVELERCVKRLIKNNVTPDDTKANVISS
jgi:CheY-like chemotaxis protein